MVLINIERGTKAKYSWATFLAIVNTLLPLRLLYKQKHQGFSLNGGEVAVIVTILRQWDMKTLDR